MESKPPSSNFRKLFPSTSEKEWEQFKKSAKNATHVIEAIMKVVENECKDVEFTRLRDFENAAWAYRRAYQDGQMTAYKKINQYLNDLKG